MVHDVHVGCWGGDGGANKWSCSLPDIGCKFTRIKIKTNIYGITGIEFSYVTRDNRVHGSGSIGSSLGTENSTLDIPYGEFIGCLRGTTDLHNGITIITSLSFKVGYTWHGPYGPKRGSEFFLPLAKGRFSGFYGFHGEYIERFGVVLSPVD